jgi:hypothetical protein
MSLAQLAWTLHYTCWGRDSNPGHPTYLPKGGISSHYAA